MAASPADLVITSDAPVQTVRYRADGVSLAGICSDGQMRIWNTSSGALQSKVSLPLPAMFPSGGENAASMGKDGAVRFSDAPATFPALTPPPLRFSVSSGRDLQASAHMPDRQSGVNVIRVRNAEGKTLLDAPAGIGGISILGFSPDGAHLVAGSFDADLRIWAVRNGELAQMITSLPVAMFAMSFSPDGKWLATAGVDRIIYLWNTQGWKLEKKITGQPEMIAAIEFSRDGKRLVTGGFSELTAAQAVEVVAWDAASGKQLRRMPAPRRVTSVTFSPDGKQVAAACNTPAVHLWGLPD